MVGDLSLRKRLALKLHTQYRKNETRLHELNYIFWECTLRCNLNCLHCGSDCSSNKEKKDMPLKDFLRAIDVILPTIDLQKAFIVFTGGEPLLRNDLELAGRELYQRKLPWGMVTNGFALSKQRLQSLMNSGLRSVTLSLDGSESSHNWMRNHSLSYQKALTSLKLLLETDLRFDVVTCVNRKNISELSALRDFFIELGLKEWRIFTIFPIGRAAENPELQLNPEEFKQVFDFISATRKSGRIKLNYGCEGYLGNYESEVRDNFFFCRAGINIASVLIDGAIAACPNLRGNFIQGNIYTDNFAEVWENRYQAYRDRSWNKKGLCADCKSYKFCEGNGMHLHDEKTGDLLFCHLKRIEEAESTLPS